MHQAIFVVVDLGTASEVMDVAEEHGAQGGTILKGRGAGPGEAGRILNMEIEPEKDILIIISQENQTEKIISSISDYLDIENANSGVLMTLNLSATRGLVE